MFSTPVWIFVATLCIAAIPTHAADCNNNGVDDAIDISSGTSQDCNSNGVPDECELDDGTREVVGWGLNDDGQTDVPSGTDFVAVSAGAYHSLALKSDGSLVGWGAGEVDTGSYPDYGQAIVPSGTDFVAVSAGRHHSLALKLPPATARDCNRNGVPDACDITAGTSQDCNTNSIPDECEPDCNGNSVADACDITAGTSQDCNTNTIPDECDPDANGNGIADDCEQPPFLSSALSRKTHGAAGVWDIDIGVGDIESRSNELGTANPPTLKIIAAFNVGVALAGGSDVLTDTGSVVAVKHISPSVLEIDLGGLPMFGQVNLSFPGVYTSGLDPVTGSCASTLCFRVIVGDYDNLARVNFLDFAKIKNMRYLNQLVATVDMARADFDCSGRSNFIDFAKVKNAALLNRTAYACSAPIVP